MREQVIAEAREWLGTRYRHQASVKGVGADCIGLVRGVGIATGVWLPNDAEAWKQFAGYSRLPNPRRMGEGMRLFLRQVQGTPQLADIAWLQWRPDLPMHLALLASDSRGDPTIIHSFSDAGGVVEHGLTAEWRGRVLSWWSFPILEGDI